MAYMPTIIVDFDGVIHSYTSGWQGASCAADLPVDGAIEWLNSMAEHFRIAILSSRSHQPYGIECMKQYLVDNGVEEKYISNENIIFPTEKVPAILQIDDRGFCFKGEFPTKEFIENFKPWNKV